MTKAGPERLLCVEDQLSLLEDLLEELSAAGYEVRGTTSVAGALEILQDFSPDLVLCDVMLGDGDQEDGYALHHHIRKERPDLSATPFILLTALGQRKNLLQAKQLGVDDYLVKPVDYDLLLATIAARLASVGRVRDTHVGHGDLLGRMREVFARLPGAVLLCDGSLSLLTANHQAQVLMQEHDLWRVDSRGRVQWPHALPASLQLLQRNLADMCSAAAGERRVQSLEMSQASDNMLLGLLKLDGAENAPAVHQLFMFFICSAQSRPVPEVETLRMLFGLTRAEARVARFLAQGLRPEAIAEELHVSIATINFHLRNLFQKTGVTRQSDLVAQILAVGWALPEMPECI